MVYQFTFLLKLFEWILSFFNKFFSNFIPLVLWSFLIFCWTQILQHIPCWKLFQQVDKCYDSFVIKQIKTIKQIKPMQRKFMGIFCWRLNTAFLHWSYIFQAEALPCCSECFWNGFITSSNVFRTLIMRNFAFIFLFLTAEWGFFFVPFLFSLFCYNFNFFQNLIRNMFLFLTTFCTFQSMSVSEAVCFLQCIGFSILTLK